MYYVQFIDKQGKTRLGTYYQAIIKDLKTLKGLRARIANGYNRPDCIGYNVYMVADSSALYALDTEKQKPLLIVKF